MERQRCIRTPWTLNANRKFHCKHARALLMSQLHACRPYDQTMSMWHLQACEHASKHACSTSSSYAHPCLLACVNVQPSPKMQLVAPRPKAKPSPPHRRQHRNAQPPQPPSWPLNRAVYIHYCYCAVPLERVLTAVGTLHAQRTVATAAKGSRHRCLATATSQQFKSSRGTTVPSLASSYETCRTAVNMVRRRSRLCRRTLT